MAACGFLRSALDGAEMSHERRSKARQPCPAAVPPAGPTIDDGLAEDGVQLLDKLPGAPVGHAHGASRRRDRTENGDLFQKLDLTGPDAAARFEIDP